MLCFILFLLSGFAISQESKVRIKSYISHGSAQYAEENIKNFTKIILEE